MNASEEDYPYDAGVIVAVIAVASAVGGIIVCCVCCILYRAAMQSELSPPAQRPGAVNSAAGHNPPARWVNCGCCYLDVTTGDVLCCEQPPATSISSATPNELQADPMSDVPLPTLSSAPPPTPTAQTMPTMPMPRSELAPALNGAAPNDTLTPTGDASSGNPVASASLPPNWVDCGCCFVNTSSGACTCFGDPFADAKGAGRSTIAHRDSGAPEDVPMTVLAAAPAPAPPITLAGPERIVMGMSTSIGGTRQLGAHSSTP